MLELRLTIIANDPLVRSGLATLLDEQANVRVVAQFSSDEIVQDLEEGVFEPVDALIWDVGWEGTAESIDWHNFPCSIIALVPEDCEPARFWQAGANGLLLRGATAVQIETAVQASLNNLHIYDPTLIPEPIAIIQQPQLEAREELTPREQEVAQLLAQGLTNKAIAHQLTISNHTVKFHVNAIMNKLDAQSRTEAVVKATRLGLISI
ncbi:MAG: response regulator transcription factor [Chloroflexota bacterium]